jgi:uncharacterized SAM-binding protein YcdF (DUF218 family)
MITPEVLTLARVLWDYHHMNHVPAKADCILALGSHDLRVADRAAELYLQGFAPLVVMSGGLGNFTQDMWTESEAEKFAAIAIRKGVPEEAILVENKSTNTGENIVYTQQLLQQKQLDPKNFIVVQKPYMERRSYATFKKHWPDKNLLVTSPQIPFVEYATDDIPLPRVINIMVGDLQRIRFYTARGFQVYQEIPPDVWEAYERLVQLGFDQHLMKE